MSFTSLKPIIKPFVIIATCVAPVTASYAETPDFTDNTLTVPHLRIGDTFFNNIQLDLNIESSTFELKSVENEHVFEMRTLLSPGNEVPASTSSGAGLSLISVDTDSGDISGFIMTNGISDLTAAHIHEGAAGISGPVIIAFDFNSDDNSFSLPAGTKLTLEQITSLKAGELYLNVHTSTNAGGELREQLNIGSGKSADAKLTGLLDR